MLLSVCLLSVFDGFVGFSMTDREYRDKPLLRPSRVIYIYIYMCVCVGLRSLLDTARNMHWKVDCVTPCHVFPPVASDTPHQAKPPGTSQSSARERDRRAPGTHKSAILLLIASSCIHLLIATFILANINLVRYKALFIMRIVIRRKMLQMF